MKIKDKKIGKMVDVADKECLKCSCYWPRPDPGSFTQGQGYSQRTTGNRGYLCGAREINGCPYRLVCHRCGTKHPEYKTHCRECGDILSNDQGHLSQPGASVAAKKDSESHGN